MQAAPTNCPLATVHYPSPMPSSPLAAPTASWFALKGAGLLKEKPGVARIRGSGDRRPAADDDGDRPFGVRISRPLFLGCIAGIWRRTHGKPLFSLSICAPPEGDLAAGCSENHAVRHGAALRRRGARTGGGWTILAARSGKTRLRPAHHGVPPAASRNSTRHRPAAFQSGRRSIGERTGCEVKRWSGLYVDHLHEISAV